ncbi:hypothetical protein, conserved [Plasmodium ovale curtisi]|uniref:Uncharacterized protein n=1 Tax=Plasmodium ovale curtisi TaxID=864141 RepID=A0A1A8X9Q0_PLAOA|nr:hypothetical protein, conserved [Plasmodium ovale curtisi]SBT00994.1 hypothetical protein, conserved [Plasmodium ovale curtisi]
MSNIKNKLILTVTKLLTKVEVFSPYIKTVHISYIKLFSNSYRNKDKNEGIRKEHAEMMCKQFSHKLYSDVLKSDNLKNDNDVYINYFKVNAHVCNMFVRRSGLLCLYSRHWGRKSCEIIF